MTIAVDRSPVAGDITPRVVIIRKIIMSLVRVDTACDAVLDRDSGRRTLHRARPLPSSGASVIVACGGRELRPTMPGQNADPALRGLFDDRQSFVASYPSRDGSTGGRLCRVAPISATVRRQDR